VPLSPQRRLGRDCATGAFFSPTASVAIMSPGGAARLKATTTPQDCMSTCSGALASTAARIPVHDNKRSRPSDGACKDAQSASAWNFAASRVSVDISLFGCLLHALGGGGEMVAPNAAGLWFDDNMSGNTMTIKETSRVLAVFGRYKCFWMEEGVIPLRFELTAVLHRQVVKVIIFRKVDSGDIRRECVVTWSGDTDDNANVAVLRFKNELAVREHFGKYLCKRLIYAQPVTAKQCMEEAAVSGVMGNFMHSILAMLSAHGGCQQTHLERYVFALRRVCVGWLFWGVCVCVY
jgi:hypothetical protein